MEGSLAVAAAFRGGCDGKRAPPPRRAFSTCRLGVRARPARAGRRSAVPPAREEAVDKGLAVGVGVGVGVVGVGNLFSRPRSCGGEMRVSPVRLRA